MNKNKTNMKDEKNLNSSSEHEKNEQLQGMPVEGACSPEFTQGCITIDHEIDE